MQTFAQFRYTEIARAFKQAPWRVQTQILATLAAVTVVLVALGGMYLVKASHTATAGRDVQSLQAQKAELLRAIDRQRALIAQAQSVVRVEARARELGLTPALPEQMEFIVVQEYPGVPPPQSAAAPDVPNYDETLGIWLANWVSRLIAPES